MVHENHLQMEIVEVVLVYHAQFLPDGVIKPCTREIVEVVLVHHTQPSNGVIKPCAKGGRGAGAGAPCSVAI
jgi:hypothetical protein